VLDLVRRRGEFLALAALFGLLFLLPKGLPSGILGLGLVGGAALALQTVGIVLVYRANRIINFAQVQIGALAGVLFILLVNRRVFLLAVHYVCPGCVHVEERPVGFGSEETYALPVNVPGWALQLNFWLSVLVSIAVVAVLSYAAYHGVIRRFADSSRLILTIVTIGLGQIFVLFQSLAIGLFREDRRNISSAPLPVQFELRVGGQVFGASEILTVVVAVLSVLAVTWFLARTSAGVLLRGIADNPNRARTLGINVDAVNSVAWLLAGVLSALASVLAATGSGAGGLGGAADLVRMLTAAVFAAMVSVLLAVLASFVLGVLDQAVLWSFQSPALGQGLLFAVVVAVLLLQRSRVGQVDTEESGWAAAREIRPIPEELRHLSAVRRGIRNGGLLLAVVILGLPWVLSPAQTNLLTDTVILAMIGLSLLVLTGWAGQISLGQFGLAAVGAYVVGVSGLPFVIALLVGAFAGAAAAVLVGLPALRLRGLNLAITTLAFALAVSAVLLNNQYLGRYLPNVIDRPAGLGLDFEDERSFYYLTLVLLSVTAFATLGMRRSRAARAHIACRDNEGSAQSFGIDIVRARLSAFAVSGFVAALSGGLFAYSQHGVQAAAFGVPQSIQAFLMVVIGGLGSLVGPLLGAAFLGATSIFGGNPLIALAGTGFGVVVILLFAPGGLSQIFFGIRDAMLRRVADRYRIVVPSLSGRRRVGTKPVLAPKTAGRGKKAFVPERYRLDGQWALRQQLQPAKEDSLV
jgi:branched-chain amino acid transport system permease protein